MHSLNETGAHLSFFEDTHIYWEKQELWRLCGLHSINSIMQGPYFNEVELSEIAHELDKKEKKLMEELGTETIDFLQYMAQDSFNVSEDGNFSVQVLEEALAKKNIKMTLISTKKEISSLYKLFSEETAMICNSGMHWFALRKINKTWYDLNSTNNFPEIMNESRIIEFLEMCVNFEYMLYAVRGNFPEHTFKEMKGKTDSKRQFWLKESHIKELNEKGPGSGQSQPQPQSQSNESSSNPQHVPTGAAATHNLEKNLPTPPSTNKFEMKLDENVDNMVINFRLPNAQLIYHVFPRSWFLEDLYEYINYKTNNNLKGRFQIITNYPDFMVLPPTKIMISKTALTAGQTLFIRTL